MYQSDLHVLELLNGYKAKNIVFHGFSTDCGSYLTSCRRYSPSLAEKVYMPHPEHSKHILIYLLRAKAA